METMINNEYQRILDYCQKNKMLGYVLDQSVEYSKGSWKTYLNILQSIPISFKDKVVVDFGCKYGHLLPLFLIMKAKKVIGIDVESDYVEKGKRIFESLYSNIEIVQSESGYIPLQPESVNFVFMNEVISHINSTFLETIYSEISRILIIGGVVYISDGNNAGNKSCKEKLLSFHEKWEYGPDGVKTDRDVVVKSYLTRRKEIILNKYPNLEKSNVEYLALNTSGLWGNYLIKTIDKYVKTGELIRRPYRKGMCPTNPVSSGVMIEKDFHPLQVEMTLNNYGVESYQFFPKPSFKDKTWKAKLYIVYNLAKSLILNIIKPHWQKTASEGFQIVGIKKS